METTIYNKAGKEAGRAILPDSVFAQAWNHDLVHEVVRAMQGNARASTAHTKVRGEVRGGGKKPWRQKGTGRARHGSRRSPIWRGGGITFGPRSERDYSRKINRTVRAKALAVALSQKLRDDEVIFLDTLSFSAPKAKEAKVVLAALAGINGKAMLATKRKNAGLVVLAGRDEATEKSFRNFGNIFVEQAKDLNPVELLTYKYVIVGDTEKVSALLAERVVQKSAKKALRRAPQRAPVTPRPSRIAQKKKSAAKQSAPKTKTRVAKTSGKKGA